jgi:SAM-dependent methyltransferase
MGIPKTAQARAASPADFPCNARIMLALSFRVDEFAMTTTSDQSHWQAMYRDKAADRVSWYTPHLATSLRLLRQAGLGPGARLIDVGGGASTLVDDALALGADVSVLDLAESALALSRARLGDRAKTVHWYAGDVREVALPPAGFDFWHDRAVLHFLTAAADARRYSVQAAQALRTGGRLLVAGFAPEGPERCSGLAVARRSVEDLDALFAGAFVRECSEREQHHTPAGGEQAFLYALYRRV